MAADLIVARPEGLYCPPGDFYIDPWRPVARAVITHAHSDHARFGHKHYLCAEPGRGVLLARLPGISLDTLPYGQRITHHGVTLSLHPAGHVLANDVFASTALSAASNVSWLESINPNLSTEAQLVWKVDEKAFDRATWKLRFLSKPVVEFDLK